MNGEIVGVEAGALAELLNFFGERPEPALIEYANASWPLCVGEYNGRLLSAMGLIPRADAQAYIWLHTFPAAGEHKLVLARRAKEFIAYSWHWYTHLIGHCNNDRSVRWLATLGATFTPFRDNIVQFEITRHGS